MSRAKPKTPLSQKDPVATDANIERVDRAMRALTSLDIIDRIHGVRALSVELRTMAQLALALSPTVLAKSLSARLDACASSLEKAAR